MKNRKLASRYARALLDSLPEPRALEAADGFLTALAAAMEQSRELRDILLDPAVPRSSRKAVLRSLAEQHDVPPRLKNFLDVIVDHGRTPELPVIARVFHEAREQELGIVPASITTAAPLQDDLKRRAGQALEKLTSRKVSLTYEVEPALIGGAITQIGSKVYDGSLRTQLARLRQSMAEE